MKHNLVTALVFFLFFSNRLYADYNVLLYLQDISVTVASGKSRGSGTVIRSNIVLTAAHVVANSYHEKKSVRVLFPTYNHHRKQVGKKSVKASIIAYSPASQKDIAILLLEKEMKLPRYVEFYQGED